MQFELNAGAARKVPHVLRVPNAESNSVTYLRLTHVFADAAYGLWVTDAAGARNAARPRRFSWADIESMEQNGAAWGEMALPDDLLWKPLNASLPAPGTSATTDSSTDGEWHVIAPLIELFTDERQLRSTHFDKAIQQRAVALDMPLVSVRRLVKRFYYFGQVRDGLRSLPPGPKPAPLEARRARISPDAMPPREQADVQQNLPRTTKRRGPKASIEADSGPNEFSPSDYDIGDMVKRLRTRARAGPTSVKASYEEYLSLDFPKRNPDVWKLYLEKKHPTPVSLKQYRNITNAYLLMEKDIAKNLRIKSAGRGGHGSLDALGPGDIYEIDATGGRIVLVTSDENNARMVATPTIYIVIDRWSRFIVSIYVSLKAPSWDEVRYALLIAFSPREARFKKLGIDIDDERWPQGRMCGALISDRGSELISQARGRAVAGNLRIEPLTLPGRTPNGKAIIERFIRTLKAWVARNVKGSYADRPLDPHTKDLASKARLKSVTSLSDLYRQLIRFVEEYNNTPHSWLKRLSILFGNANPTPREAYLWGIANITGARRSSYSDSQLQKMLLAIGNASIKDGVLTYKTWKFKPANVAAQVFAAASTSKRRPVKIRFDKTFPHEIFIEGRNEWPCFRMVEADQRALGYATLDEYEEVVPLARREHRSFEEEQRRATHAEKAGTTKPKRPTVDRSIQSQQQIADDRQFETAQIKSALTDKHDPVPVKKAAIEHNVATGKNEGQEWEQRLEKNRLMLRPKRKAK